MTQKNFGQLNLITKVYQSPKTVFTTKDLALLWEDCDIDTLKSKIAYYVKEGALRRLRRGVFVKKDVYDAKELATSIYQPSYISFETVLREAGIIFQHYDTIFVAAPWSRNISIDGKKIVYRTMKKGVLYNSAGVLQKGVYSIATPERAFVDMLYLYPRFYFDNLRALDWEQCLDLAKMYNNKQLLKRIMQCRAQYV